MIETWNTLGDGWKYCVMRITLGIIQCMIIGNVYMIAELNGWFM